MNHIYSSSFEYGWICLNSRIAQQTGKDSSLFQCLLLETLFSHNSQTETFNTRPTGFLGLLRKKPATAMQRMSWHCECSKQKKTSVFQSYFKIADAGHSVTLEDYSALHLVHCGASEPLWLDVQCLVSSPFLLCFMAFASLLQQWPQNAQWNAGQSWKTPDSSRVITITVDLKVKAPGGTLLRCHEGEYFPF